MHCVGVAWCEQGCFEVLESLFAAVCMGAGGDVLSSLGNEI
jgi:hypothetical protein